MVAFFSIGDLIPVEDTELYVSRMQTCSTIKHLYSLCQILYLHYKIMQLNKVNFLNFLTYLKQKINIEKQICSTEGRNDAFESFILLLDHLG